MMIDLPCETIRTDIEEVCAMFRTALLNIGLDEGAVKLLCFEQCKLTMMTDNYDGETIITGHWLNPGGEQCAYLIRYANGTMFAEQDVLLPFPTDPGMFFEAVEVWGKLGALKYEARLLPAL